MKLKEESGNYIYLEDNKSIASGGEGKIFVHPNNSAFAIKAYHSPKPFRLKNKYNELNKLNENTFIKPLSLLYDLNDDIAGFIMKYVDVNQYFVLKKLTSKSFCNQNNFDRKFKYKIFLKIKSALKDAHEKNIIIGDLNPYNILFNKKADILFVDIDSYGVKKYPHNGVILDDVRDFILDPNINKQTDYYALAVLTFWMFTYVHPYRGMLKGYGTLKERANECLSLLKKRTGLIIPPVYEEFNNQNIINQFIEIFENKKRFLIDFTETGIQESSSVNYMPPSLNNKDLFIKIISQDVLNINASDNLLVVYKKNIHEIFDISNYGKTIKKEEGIFDNIFIGNNKFLTIRNNKLYSNNSIEISNINNVNSFQYFTDKEGTFICQENNNAFTLNPDKVIGAFVDYDKINIFYPSINIQDSILQHIGGKNFLLTINGKQHRTILLDKNAKNAYKRSNIALLEYLEDNKIKYAFYKIDQYKASFLIDWDEYVYFDVRGDLIFIPSDKQIKVYSIENKKEILNINCEQCKAHSKVFYTNAGIILHTDENVYLLNKK